MAIITKVASITSTASKILSAGEVPWGQIVYFQFPNNTASCYIGPTNTVTSVNGFLIPSGVNTATPLGLRMGGQEIWAITTGTADLRMLWIGPPFDGAYLF